jgi:hypothetical protein
VKQADDIRGFGVIDNARDGSGKLELDRKAGKVWIGTQQQPMIGRRLSRPRQQDMPVKATGPTWHHGRPPLKRCRRHVPRVS